MVGGLLLFQIAPQQLLSLFDASEAMTEMGTSALRIISTHFPVAAFWLQSCPVAHRPCRA